MDDIAKILKLKDRLAKEIKSLQDTINFLQSYFFLSSKDSELLSQQLETLQKSFKRFADLPITSKSNENLAAQEVANLFSFTKISTEIIKKIENCKQTCAEVGARLNWQDHLMLVQQRFENILKSDQSQENLAHEVENYYQLIKKAFVTINGYANTKLLQSFNDKYLLDEYEELSNDNNFEKYGAQYKYIDEATHNNAEETSQLLLAKDDFKAALANMIQKQKSTVILSTAVFAEKLSILGNQQANYLATHKINANLLDALYDAIVNYAEQNGATAAKNKFIDLSMIHYQEDKISLTPNLAFDKSINLSTQDLIHVINNNFKKFHNEKGWRGQSKAQNALIETLTTKGFKVDIGTDGLPQVATPNIEDTAFKTPPFKLFNAVTVHQEIGDYIDPKQAYAEFDQSIENFKKAATNLETAINQHKALQINKANLTKQLKENLVADIKNILNHTSWPMVANNELNTLIVLRDKLEQLSGKSSDDIINNLHDTALEHLGNNNSYIKEFCKTLSEVDCKNHDSLVTANNTIMNLHNQLAATANKENRKRLNEFSDELMSEINNLFQHSKWSKSDYPFIKSLQQQFKEIASKDDSSLIALQQLQVAIPTIKHSPRTKIGKELVAFLKQVNLTDPDSIMDAMANIADIHNKLTASSNTNSHRNNARAGA